MRFDMTTSDSISHPMTLSPISEQPLTPQRLALPQLAIRGLGAGFLAGCVAALGFSSLAQAQNISGFDSNQPVVIDAERFDLQDRQNRVVFSGDVIITQGDLQLKAGRTTIAYTDKGSLEIQRVDATGGVIVTRGNERASGTAAVYDFNRKLIVLSGDVSLKRGEDMLTGGRLVIDLASGVSSVDGKSEANASRGGRVSGTFSVPE